MEKMPDYVNKIKFEGIAAFINARNYLYKGLDPSAGWQILNKYYLYDTMKLTDAYKFSPSLAGCKKIIREVGKRVDDMLTMAGIEYQEACFYARSNLYDYVEHCYGRPHIKITTKDNKQLLLDCFKENEFIIHDVYADERIHYSISGTNFSEDFNVNKITQVQDDRLDNDVFYKSYKNQNVTTYKIFDSENKLEISVGNREITDENNLIKVIKNISLNNYNIEYILRKIKENISLQKDDKTHLSIRRYNENVIQDELSIIDGTISIIKPLNAEKKISI